MIIHTNKYISFDDKYNIIQHCSSMPMFNNDMFTYVDYYIAIDKPSRYVLYKSNNDIYTYSKHHTSTLITHIKSILKTYDNYPCRSNLIKAINYEMLTIRQSNDSSDFIFIDNNHNKFMFYKNRLLKIHDGLAVTGNKHNIDDKCKIFCIRHIYQPFFNMLFCLLDL